MFTLETRQSKPCTGRPKLGISTFTLFNLGIEKLRQEYLGNPNIYT